MKLTKLLFVPLAFSFGLLGGSASPSGITVNCLSGGSSSTGGTSTNCNSGQVTFTGTGYPNKVRVVVTNSEGELIDNGLYDTTGGVLSFTEDFSFPDTYTVDIKHGGNLNGGSLLDEEAVTTAFPQ